MRRSIITLLLIVLFLSSCSSSTQDGNKLVPENNESEIDAAEMKRVELYTTVMKAAFEIENGGDSFIAIRLDTLEGLSSSSQERVLESFTDLSPNVYSYEDIKDDPTRIEWYNNKFPNRAIDGTVLSVRLIEFDNDRAQIEAISWFGALGAVLPEYEATYENGKWQLETVGFAIS